LKNKILLLTGAGLTAGPDFFNVGTLGLTEQFIHYHDPELSPDKKLVNFIYTKFCEKHKLDPLNHAGNLYQINFETILHIIEELHAFVEDIEKEHLGVKHQNSIKSTVFKMREEILNYIQKARILKGKHPFYLFFEQLHNHLIDVITEGLAPHNNDAENKGMMGFRDFLNKEFPTESFSRRIYTLNYDNWLSKIGGYFDGFDDNRFDGLKVIQDRLTDCHYNLHGCILWDWFGNGKLDHPRTLKHIQSGNEPTISREAILPAPIISGYNKLTRIYYHPFLHIFHSFLSDVTECNRVLVIGYSFSDPHINAILKLAAESTPVTVVVYMHAASLGSELSYLAYTLYNVFGSNFEPITFSDQYRHTIISQDGRITVFLKGIGPDFYCEYPRYA
jgi:hypothetical protein